MVEWETIIVGIFSAIITFFYMKWQVNKTHERNLEAQKTLFKQEVEYKAYCKIQEALDQYSSVLISSDADLQSLNIHLSLLEKGIVLRSDWANIPRELIELNSRRADKFIEFLKSYDSNEIIIFDFKPLKDEITKEHNMLSEILSEFHKSYLDKIYGFSDRIPPIENISEMKEKIKTINEKAIDITGYVYDFRIEMQNRILGPILGKSVPKRQPGDKSVKVLSLK